MSKYSVFSDLHTHNYGQFNNGSERLLNCLKVPFDIAEFSVSRGINKVLFVGDWFDTQKALLTEVVNETVDKMIELFTTYPDLIIISISGNHDHASKNLLDKPAITAQKFLARMFPENFILIDNDVYVDGDVAIYGIPYYEYAEHFDKALDMAVQMREDTGAKFNYLMIHQTPAGLSNAMIPSDCNPKDDRFKLFDHVFCGHIHANQSLSDSFTIVGSPIHRDMGDVGKDKGFLVFNAMNTSKKPVFVPLKGYPVFVEAYEDEVENLDNSSDFVVVKPRLDLAESTAVASVENFSTALKESELMENFWGEVDGKNESLLKTGLNILNKL